MENKTNIHQQGDKQIVVYPHNGRPVSKEKELLLSLNNADECQNQCGIKAGQREGEEGRRELTAEFQKTQINLQWRQIGGCLGPGGDG